MGEKKFYICKHCGNMIGMIKSSGVNVVCCGDPMTELKPNTVEASQEKHLPVVTIEGNIVKVKVGSVEQCWIWGRQSKRRLCDGSNRLGVSGGARSGGSSRCLAAFALAVFCFRCLRICSMTFGSSMLAITLT